MATTIAVPDAQQIGAYPQAIVEALTAVATAAAVDVNALQARATALEGSAGTVPVHLVRGASTANVSLSACSTTFDGLTLVAGDRVLLKDQSTGHQNGIYVVGTVVAGPVAPLTRATDFDAAAEVQPGCLVSVAAGTANGDKVFVLTTNAAITIGSTSLAFGEAISTALSSDTPAAVGTAAVGVGTTAARSDHVHAHGNQLGGGLHADATASVAGFQSAAGKTKEIASQLGAGLRVVRGVVTANVADIAAFVIAGNDGLTYAAGQRVLLALQTTPAQNGIYVVGTVAGTAPLTRAADFALGDAIVNGCCVEVSEGTLYAGTTWKAMCTGACVVATDDPLFYPKEIRITVTLSAGAKTLDTTQGVWLFSTTKSNVHPTCNTPIAVTATVGLSAPVASRTAGKRGTASVLINAFKADATVDTDNVSKVDITIFNA